MQMVTKWIPAQFLSGGTRGCKSRVIKGIATRSRELADQNMAPTKCHCLLLQPAEAVGPTTKEDVEALGLLQVYLHL
jgi:hypothetical protein